MNFTISPDGKTLTITVDSDEQNYLKLALRAEESGNENYMMLADRGFHSDAYMYEVLSPITDDGELEWIFPDEIGALTSAPILGIRNLPCDWPDCDHYPNIGSNSPYCAIHSLPKDASEQDYVTAVEEATESVPVLQAWGFMDYQIRSVQEDLANTGIAVFIGGPVEDETYQNESQDGI